MADEPRDRDPFDDDLTGAPGGPRMVPVPELPEWKKPGWLPSVENLVIEAVRRFANRFRHVRVLGQWFVYAGGVWSWDERDAVTAELGTMCRDIGTACKRGMRMKLEDGKIVQTIERRLRAELAATSEQWDADPLQVNVPWRAPGGPPPAIVPQRSEDYCTRQTAVAPEAMATPMWDDFIRFVTGGDGALQAYLQRAAGYSASGSTKEQCLFVLHGPGANGKSVFLNTVAGVLGSYAATMPVETIAARAHERHPEELARLKGVRMVVSAETESGHVWNEARIKMLTGGEKIVARFMRENSFEYTPQFKLWLATNNKPQLRSVDPAITRRLHLVPFTQTVAKEARILDLDNVLKCEWPGILHWVLEGFATWQDEGLRPPDIVTAATEQYIASEDVIAMWIEEALDALPTAATRSSELFASWKKWAEARGEFVGSHKALTQQLGKKGFKTRRGNRGVLVVGLAIPPPRPSADERDD